jgi:hypothetical protein
VIRNRRTLAYVAIALIVGAALAVAVALAQGGPSASHTASAGLHGQSSAALLGDTGVAGSTSGGTLSADPAKEEPLLDKFVSKDPFVPLGAASTTAAPTTTTNTSNLGAKIKVNGTSYSVVTGDKVPGGSPAFSISSVTSSDVTFAVVTGSTKSGDASVTVNLGESVKVPLDSGKSYTLSVTSIGKSSSGSTNGHTISVTSVTTTNGTALATIVVDGTTYSDKKIGAVFATSAGQIKVIDINANAQTVTIMLGDQTITLSAGQVVIK